MGRSCLFLFSLQLGGWLTEKIPLAVSPHRPKPHGLGFELPAFDFGQEGEADLLQAVAVGPGLLSARAFGGLLHQDLAVSVVQLGGGEFEGIGQGMNMGIA